MTYISYSVMFNQEFRIRSNAPVELNLRGRATYCYHNGALAAPKTSTFVAASNLPFTRFLSQSDDIHPNVGSKRNRSSPDSWMRPPS